jgi:hypothetical protein
MDMPYRVFFGMAMLPLAANLAAALIGAFINAQEFEFQTILEYRLSPISIYLISCARLCRLSITGLISGLTLLVVMGISTGIWPSSMVGIILVLLVMGLIGGCVGTLAGLNLQKVLPSFLIGLALSFFTWIMGSAFGLAAGFSGPYQVVSRFMPNTYAVELLFPYFFEVDMGSESKPILVLIFFCVFLVSLTVLTYRRKVLSVAKK